VTRKRRVLVVDDDSVTREGLADLIAHSGYEAESAASFQEALRMIRTHPPDVVLTDIRLGEYNGLQLVIDSPDTVRAIVITGFADSMLEAEARRYGAAYLVKPIDPDGLVQLIDALLEPPTP
jgi:DNA-binding response OmpR family regulator